MFKAMDTKLQRVVALKLLQSPHYGERELQRFLREARAGGPCCRRRATKTPPLRKPNAGPPSPAFSLIATACSRARRFVLKESRAAMVRSIRS